MRMHPRRSLEWRQATTTISFWPPMAPSGHGIGTEKDNWEIARPRTGPRRCRSRGSPTTLYAWSEQGLYKSTDGAAAWSALPLPVTDVFPRWSSTPGKQARSMSQPTPRGVVKSVDGGASWSRVNFGQPPGPDGHYPNITLAIDAKNSGTLYAISFRDGVFRSTDRAPACWPTMVSRVSSRSAKPEHNIRCYARPRDIQKHRCGEQAGMR